MDVRCEDLRSPQRCYRAQKSCIPVSGILEKESSLLRLSIPSPVLCKFSNSFRDANWWNFCLKLFQLCITLPELWVLILFCWKYSSVFCHTLGFTDFSTPFPGSKHFLAVNKKIDSILKKSAKQNFQKLFICQ